METVTSRVHVVLLRHQAALVLTDSMATVCASHLKSDTSSKQCRADQPCTAGGEHHDTNMETSAWYFIDTSQKETDDSHKSRSFLLSVQYVQVTTASYQIELGATVDGT